MYQLLIVVENKLFYSILFYVRENKENFVLKLFKAPIAFIIRLFIV
jgi:hypothetical protein